jgi:hypothetical protein
VITTQGHQRIPGWSKIQATDSGTVFSQHENSSRNKEDQETQGTSFVGTWSSLFDNGLRKGEHHIILALTPTSHIHERRAEATGPPPWGLVASSQLTHPHLPEADTRDKSSRGKPIDGIWTTLGLDGPPCC